MVKQKRRTDRCFLPAQGNGVAPVQFPVCVARRRQPPPPQSSRKNQTCSLTRGADVQLYNNNSSSTTTEEERRRRHPEQQERHSGETEPKTIRLHRCKEGAALISGEEFQGSCDPAGDDDQQDSTEQSEDSIAAEVQSAGSLKVTIQQRGEKQQKNLKVTYEAHDRVRRLTEQQLSARSIRNLVLRHQLLMDQHLFQVHMLGSEHLKKLQEVTQSICTNAYRLQDRGHHATTQRWCDSCQTHFSGCVITHRRTGQHKMCKQLSRPFCLVCKRHFRTPRKFVEHMKSAEHKQQVRLDEAQDDELITVDAVGCFEGEEEEADVADEEDEENIMLKATASEEAVGEEYDPYQTYGSAFVVPVSGFLCRLCNKFFYGEMTARYTHCRTRAHYMNMQRHTNTDPEGRTRPVPEALTWS